MSLLKVENINKSFNGIEAVNNISFELQKGKTLSIIGSSGSGKTTLLRCLNFLETPDSGKIYLDNNLIYDASKDILNENQKRDIRMHFSLVFQQFNLFPQYTVLENVLLAPKLLKKDINKDDAIQLLNTIGLKDRINYYPHQLSGGQQQRVAIARALIMKPDVLCFDEPTSALDPELTNEVLKVIKDLSNKNYTMIIVTHEINFAKEVSHEVIFMDKGEIIEKGIPSQVINNPNNPRTIQFLSSMLD